MTLSILIAALAAVPLALVQASFVEWAFHALWLHRAWRPERLYVAHTLVHHQLCKFGDTFLVLDAEQEEGVDLPWWVGPSLAVAGTLPWAAAGLAVWLTGWNGPVWIFVASFALVSAGYRLAHDRVHRLVHHPAGSRFESTAFFRVIDRRHRIHHARLDRNLNLLLPLADRLLGSDLRQAPIPMLTPLTARKLARRYSRFGRTLAAASPRRVVAMEMPPAFLSRAALRGTSPAPAPPQGAEPTAAPEPQLAARR